jgi:hypothetical protein
LLLPLVVQPIGLELLKKTLALPVQGVDISQQQATSAYDEVTPLISLYPAFVADCILI